MSDKIPDATGRDGAGASARFPQLPLPQDGEDDRRYYEDVQEAAHHAAVDAPHLDTYFPSMITVESANGTTHVTFPHDEVPMDRLNAMIDWLRLEAIARKSQLTAADADRLAEESKASWWAANQDRFIPPTK